MKQVVLARPLSGAEHGIAVVTAREYGVSMTPIRRDIPALVADGSAHRVRGGAVPITPTTAPLHAMLATEAPVHSRPVTAAIAEIGSATTLLVNSGRTLRAVVENLFAHIGRTAITSSSRVAIACQIKGIDVSLLGGTLRAQGDVAPGEYALERIAKRAADIAIIGACGLDRAFDRNSDDHDKAQIKRSMRPAARRTIVVTDKRRIGRRARHHTFPLAEIDGDISNAPADDVDALRPTTIRLILSS